MSLVLDVYCKSKAHLSERFRDAVCKKWDQEHPDLAPQRDSASDSPPPPAREERPRPPARNEPPPAPRTAPPPPTPARAPPAVAAAVPSATASAPANSTATNPFLATGPNPSPLPTGDVGGASVDPFTGTTSAESQNATPVSAASSGGNQTVLIVSSIVAALFAVMLVGAFVMYRIKRKKTTEQQDKRGTMMLENGIFDAVPRANPKADFTIEDFAAAPNGLYEDEDGTSAVEKKPQVPTITTQLSDAQAPATPLTPWGSKSATDGNSLIFSSPYEHADTEYHISEDHVFGAPMYVVPRVGVAGINLTTPNAAAVAQNAQNARANSPSNPRHSMEWPAEFDDDPLNPEFGYEIPYGANMATTDGIEEFPDVPKYAGK